MYTVDKNLTIENASIGFKNFSGKEGQFIHIAVNVMEGHFFVETALQIAYCGQFAHRLTHSGYCEFTKHTVLYAVKPDGVINAAEYQVRSVKRYDNYVLTFFHLLDSCQWSYNPLPRFPGDRNPLRLTICPRK